MRSRAARPQHLKWLHRHAWADPDVFADGTSSSRASATRAWGDLERFVYWLAWHNARTTDDPPRRPRRASRGVVLIVAATLLIAGFLAVIALSSFDAGWAERYTIFDVGRS